MSKEEFLKIQTYVMKVNIHCDGCKQKVKKILNKIEGVYTTSIDSEQGKVTVSGNVDPAILIKKLNKSGKHAELWAAQKPPNNNLQNQPKILQNSNGKGPDNNLNNKPQKGGGNNSNSNNQLKVVQQNPNQILTQFQNNQQQQQMLPQQLQQLQQMKGFPDLKVPQMKDLKIPLPSKELQNSKPVNFKLPPADEEGFTDDEFEDNDDYDFEDDDDEIDDLPPLDKMKLGNGNGLGPQGANMISNGMMTGRYPQFMNTQLKAAASGGIGNNARKGGGGNPPVVVQGGGNGANIGGCKKGGGNVNNDRGNQNQGTGCGINGGVIMPADAKNGNQGGKDGGVGSKDVDSQTNGKKGGVNNGIHAMSSMDPVLNNGDGSAQMGQMGPMPLAQMANMQMGRMGSVPAVHCLPASAMNGGVGRGPGYFQGTPPEMAAADNPFQQQLVAQMMMDQQRANGNERFQPIMYARPPPSLNYMPPNPYPYPSPPGPDPRTNYFNDDNTSSCKVM